MILLARRRSIALTLTRNGARGSLAARTETELQIAQMGLFLAACSPAEQPTSRDWLHNIRI